jgi:hypothetical protein
MAETVTELRALAERLADTHKPWLEDPNHPWDTVHRTVLAAAGESVDLLREASDWSRPDGTEAFPPVQVELILLGALHIAERWATPVDTLASELSYQCVYGIPARPGRGYRHHPELVRLARERLASEHERAMVAHPDWALPLADAHEALDTFEHQANRLTFQVVQ